MKIVKKIQLKTVIFTAEKNHSILHGRVFTMLNYFFCSHETNVRMKQMFKRHGQMKLAIIIFIKDIQLQRDKFSTRHF